MADKKLNASAALQWPQKLSKLIVPRSQSKTPPHGTSSRASTTRPNTANQAKEMTTSTTPVSTERCINETEGIVLGQMKKVCAVGINHSKPKRIDNPAITSL